MPGKKAIFIDSANLFHAGRVLGIGSFNFTRLMKFLVQDVGECHELHQRPKYVAAPHRLAVIRKILGAAGFEPVDSVSFQSKDDALIIKAISELPDGIEELVLVSADADYPECLRAAKLRGIRVYVVATDTLDAQNSNRSMVSESMKNEFIFVDIANFKDQVMQKAWVDRAGVDYTSGVAEDGGGVTSETQRSAQSRQLSRHAKNVCIELLLTDNPSTVAELWQELSVLIAKLSNLRVTAKVSVSGEVETSS
ncbi:MAG: hypothetical protein A2831_02000 [Candidatus Yanofskybacteria bacterium RIFCSPHIGHO2_01_FULL_44_17]|uniref:NYN domain-containing protein n=1 Tax=Candidatus Yanofskybacteria bacterium RIFCSPHIGHO2_01_FULL_44_17 TaxID=1802668 RepID=A0A1F8EVA6_9BACT|nr:MAG: hypothetical protein A2831_02000 [Candidatus Yanofskybacteria bacterium RIFCSPHIGHO2_01_FULL_44_17]